MKNTTLSRGDIGETLASQSPGAEPARLRIAYLINLYPKVSHAFIRREIAALESCGLEVERFSLRRAPEALAEEADRAELGRTQIVLEAGVVRVVFALVSVCFSRPLRFAKALWLAL